MGICEGTDMNLKELAESAGLEEVEYLEILQLFLDTSRSDLDELESAMSAGSAPRTAEAAHSLKGAAASFGFQEFYETARTLEMNARRNALGEGMEPVRVLRARLDEIERAFHKSRETN